MTGSGGTGAVFVILVILGSILGLWVLAVVVLRRLSQQLDDDMDENPFTTLDNLLARGNIDEPEYEQRRRELLRKSRSQQV